MKKLFILAKIFIDKDMKKLIVNKRLFITTTDKDGQIFAEIGDTLTVKDRGAEHYTIVKVNNKPIFSIWQRKPWVENHCEKQTTNS